MNLVCVLLFLIACSESTYQVVDHKFVLSGHSYLTNDHHFRSIAMVKIIKMHTTFVYWWWLACTGSECPYTKSILCLANDQARLPLHNSSHYRYVLNYKATSTIHKLSGCKWLSWRSHSHSSLTTTWCTAILRHGIRWNFQPKWPGYGFQTLIEHCFALCINNHVQSTKGTFLIRWVSWISCSLPHLYTKLATNEDKDECKETQDRG